MLLNLELPVKDNPDYRLLQLSPEGRRLAVSYQESAWIAILEVPSGKLIKVLEGTDRVQKFLFLSETRLLVLTLGPPVIIDLETDQTHLLFPDLENFEDVQGSACAINRDRSILAVMTERGLILTEVATKQILRKFKTTLYAEYCYNVSFSPDGRYVACDSPDPKARSGGAACVQYWEVASGRKLRIFDARGQGDPIVAFHPDHGQIAIAIDTWLGIYGTDDIDPIATHEAAAGFISHLRYSTTGKTLEMVSYKGDFARIDPLSGQVFQLQKPPEGLEINQVTINPKGLIAGSTENGIAFWNIPEEEEAGAKDPG